MTEIKNKECPRCGHQTGVVVHVDEIPCVCGKLTNVEYVACECGYSWRSANDQILDECQIEVSEAEELKSDLEAFLKEQGFDLEHLDNANLSESLGNSMQDMIHKCLRCDSLAIKVSQNLYECTECNFAWEVDSLDG